MRRMSKWCLRSKTDSLLYAMQSLKNLQRQLDYGPNFPACIMPSPQPALSLHVIGFSEDVQKDSVQSRSVVSEEVMGSHLTFLLCVKTHLPLCLKRHSSATGFWVNGLFSWFFSSFLLSSIYFPNPCTAALARNEEEHIRDSEAPCPPDSPHSVVTGMVSGCLLTARRTEKRWFDYISPLLELIYIKYTT